MTKVEIQETSLVIPSIPPSSGSRPHALPLSHLDSSPNLRAAYRYVRAFINCPGSHSSPPPHADPFAAISSGLSSALVHYYPFAGTIRPCLDDPYRLEVFCCPGQGIPLIRAVADCTLESLEYLDDVDPGFLEQLAPNPGADELMSNPCILQVTLFKCGGFTLGTTMNNAMCDGAGATKFFEAVAGLARGVGQMNTEPIWDRAALLGPRDPPRVEASFEDFRTHAVVPREPRETEALLVKQWVHVHVEDESVEAYKSWLVEKCGVSFTTFEALGAFIWRAKVKASGLPLQDNVTFSYLINIAKIMNPTLPVGYYGNSCVPIYVHLTVSDLIEKPIWETAVQIKTSKKRATDEYVRSYIDFHELNIFRGRGDSSSGRLPHLSMFTDWRHLGHSKLDFGWGGPVNVIPLTRSMIGSKEIVGREEPCYFLPYSSARKEKPNGFKVLVNLLGDLAGFQEEMEKFPLKFMISNDAFRRYKL